MIGDKREIRVEADGNSVQMNRAEKQHGGETYRTMWVRPPEEGRQAVSTVREAGRLWEGL